MITDSQTYINKSKVGVGTVYSTHNEHITENETEYWYNSKGREDIKVSLKNSYQFNWEKINDWYFLELTIEMQKPKAYNIEEIRKSVPNAYEKWTITDDEKLEKLFCEQKTVNELSEIFKRKKGAIESRIKKLELKEKYGS
ncbi:hypothetical protein JE952_002514 [Flavobacterium psychrophilum]|nr:hypothetical protein [Flavobacterium psychrophilum]